MDKIVEVKCLEHRYNDTTTIELCGLEFSVSKGEKVAILGPNGGGKTTLIKHVLGLLKADQKGSISVFGVDPVKEYDKIRHRIGVVLQSVDEQLIGPTVLDDILFAPLNYNYAPEVAMQKVNDIMESFKITHLKDKLVHYLSGGEKRKVALAGALVIDPEILILDEPFSALDVSSQSEFIDLINSVAKERHISVLLTTHDIELVSRYADTLYLISSGNQLSRKGTPEEILSNADLLKEFNLEQPTVIKLFDKLKQNGLDLGSPINVDQACKLILERIEANKYEYN